MPDHFALLVACSATPEDHGAADRIRHAAREVTDWDGVLESAEAHGLVPLTCRALLDHAGDALAPAVRERLTRERMAAIARALDASRQLVAVLQVLDGAAVAALAYKGPALALDAYGDATLRSCDDLDVVVAPQDLTRASAALVTNGYSPTDGLPWRESYQAHGWQGHVSLTRRGEPLPVELHWRFCDRKLPWNPPLSELLARAGRHPLAGAVVAEAERHDQLLLVLLHAARHGWDRLEAIACAAALLARGIDGTLLLARARAVGGVRASLCGLELVRRVTGIALPAAVTAALTADGALARLADRGEARLRRGDAGGAGDARDAAFHLASLDGAGDRVRYVALHAALPTPQDRAVVRLPRLLAPLYVAVRLVRLVRLVVRALTGPRVTDRTSAAR